MAISNSGPLANCEDSEGDWDEIPFNENPQGMKYHDKCATITTALPMMYSSDSAGANASGSSGQSSAVEIRRDVVSVVPSSPQRIAPTAPAAAASAASNLRGAAWWLVRRPFLPQQQRAILRALINAGITSDLLNRTWWTVRGGHILL
jgi:hypothetical protein